MYLESHLLSSMRDFVFLNIGKKAGLRQGKGQPGIGLAKKLELPGFCL
jgi:hypothetical protein